VLFERKDVSKLGERGLSKRTVSGITLTLLLIGMLMLAFDLQPVKSKSRAWTIDGWAVLLEMNEFPEGWSDMPVEFINSERMQTALFSLGWQSDHVHVIHDNLTISVVQEAVGWLVNNTDYGEIALLYIFTHGTWMRNVLLWNDWFPAEWERLNTSKKVLMVDTCRAEACIEPIRNDSSPHISLAHCSAHEVGWAGLEEEGLPIIGSVWNYYFCNALLNSSADLNDDGYVSIEEAFNFSTPLVQRYMNETVFAVPEFLEMYHDIGIYPENYDAYPHPVMDDQYPEQLNLDLRPHWTTSFDFIPENPSINESITFNATASSDPDGNIVNYTWDFGDGNITSVTEPIINHKYSSGGNYTVTLNVTDNDGVWSITSKSLTVHELNHDIAVTNVEPSKTVVCQGYSMKINVTVENQGDYNETFNVTVYANTTIVETKEITLTSGNSTTITFNWNTTGLTEYQNYTISAYAHPVPGEINTGNTFIDGLILTIHTGDVIIDKKVRVDDVLAVAMKFGLNIGDPDWHPITDINCDDKVRVDDVLATAKEFGWTITGVTSTDNNVFTDGIITIVHPGDINADKKVDMKDIGFVARKFGCNYPDSCYEPVADINDDDKIDMRDIAIPARHFGEEFEDP